MNTTYNNTVIKWPSIQKTNHHFGQRKSSLQIGKDQSIAHLTKIQSNYLSSYPIFQTKKSKILAPIKVQQNVQEQQYHIQRKKSSFLKNYNQKLKRERKRQVRLKSNIKNHNSLNHTRKGFMMSDKQAESSQLLNRSFKSEQNSQILVLKKHSFIDTSSNLYKSKKNNSNEINFKLLLKQIYEMKDEQKRQIQRIHAYKSRIQIQGIQIKNGHPSIQNCFTKYGRGFTLPMKRKLTGCSSNDMKVRAKNIKRRQQQNEQTLIRLGFTTKNKVFPNHSNNNNNPHKIQKLYNFKNIDPWQNHHQSQNHIDDHSNQVEQQC